MPAAAPEYVTDDNERELYRSLSCVFEDYCSVDENLNDTELLTALVVKEQSFLIVLNVVRDTLKEHRGEALDIEKRLTQ